ncbi:MAG: TonB-dependent receptor [Pseudomonadota bacterium]|nr:TonB-dependent receptor [Pseudomonadota bacterium]
MKKSRLTRGGAAMRASFALLGGVSSLALGAAASAQDPAETEDVILVTGIRASLETSANIKRDSSGVVDAITAEDIGAFPDSNLAESIQRISGVSIDRSNNEGSRVTVRGFGPEFNLVTLNGRQMPTSNLGADSTRSFDFANLASEGVSGVEVYKTSNATIPSGGIGSTINIKTARPLDRPGFIASLSAKALHDTTNVTGSDVTPEVAATFSDTFADNKIGVGLFYSYQKRDSRLEQADIALWRENIDDLIPASTVVVDHRTGPTNTWYPRNYGFGIENISRTRMNGQAVLQFQPVDSLRATLDYTYSEFENEGLRQGVGIWFGDFPQTTQVEIDENGTYVFVEDQCCDYASNQRLNKSRNENNSIGFNLDFQPTDRLSLVFDFHDSDAISKGVDRGNDVFLILAANCIDTKSADFRTGNDIPDMAINWGTCTDAAANGEPTAGSYDSLFGQAGANVNESDIRQYQFAGEWKNPGDSGLTSIQFGAGRINNEYRTRSFNTGQIAAGWYGGNEGVYDDSIFTRVSTDKLLKRFSGGGSNISPDFYYDWDFEEGIAAFEQAFNGGERLEVDFDATPIFDHTINEKTTSAYLQFNAEGDFNNIPIRMTGGVRYEDTSVAASSLQIEVEEIVWVNSTEWSVNRAADQTYSDVRADYSLWLPNLDVSAEIFDDVLLRFSYSKSVTRPTLVSMQGTTSVTDRPKPGERMGTAGNPALQPFTSDNIDVSLEWYYNEGSYISVGAFHKQVDNFIVNQQTDEIVGNLRDPSAGPRAMQAALDVAGMGGDPTDPVQIHNQININAGNPIGTPIVQNDDDPLINWRITAPSNLESAELYGFEFAIQHLFWDTGFGLQANATLVDGDIDVDVSQVGFQFVLPGLSDSYNLVGFYDKNGLQARVAYNWRGEFLSSTENNQPQFTESFGQLDARISYDITDQLTVFAEGINITNESQRIYNRYENQLRTANQFGARYAVGLRFIF